MKEKFQKEKYRVSFRVNSDLYTLTELVWINSDSPLSLTNYLVGLMNKGRDVSDREDYDKGNICPSDNTSPEFKEIVLNYRKTAKKYVVRNNKQLSFTTSAYWFADTDDLHRNFYLYLSLYSFHDKYRGVEFNSYKWFENLDMNSKAKRWLPNFINLMIPKAMKLMEDSQYGDSGRLINLPKRIRDKINKKERIAMTSFILINVLVLALPLDVLLSLGVGKVAGPKQAMVLLLLNSLFGLIQLDLAIRFISNIYKEKLSNKVINKVINTVLGIHWNNLITILLILGVTILGLVMTLNTEPRWLKDITVTFTEITNTTAFIMQFSFILSNVLSGVIALIFSYNTRFDEIFMFHNLDNNRMNLNIKYKKEDNGVLDLKVETEFEYKIARKKYYNINDLDILKVTAEV